jgi:biotin carboxyl carrier protein
VTRPDQAPRTPAQREADHAAIAQLSDALLPALVQRLNASGLGELEVREGDWSVRLRRPPHAAGGGRRGARSGAGHHVPFPADAARQGRDIGSPPEIIRGDDGPGSAADRRAIATSPAVGVFRPTGQVGARVRAGDRIAVVDLLGIPQDVLAPIDGTLVDMFVQAGEAVEYGEEIAAVEADAPSGVA